jgi:manganese oxidase
MSYAVHRSLSGAPSRRQGALRGFAIAVFIASIALLAPSSARAVGVQCARTLTADVVVFDQPLMYNRLGAQNINGIMYALRRDVVKIPNPGELPSPNDPLLPGQVMLRPDKRPRPLVLRMAAGDCLVVNFQNLLNPLPNAVNPPAGAPATIVDDQVASRMAGFHAQGLEVLDGVNSDGSNVGKNGSSLVPPGGTIQYKLHGPHEGAYLVTSHGATFGSDGLAGNSANGMFAAVNVEPAGASFYRSQVTEEELRLATRGKTADGQPIVDYQATYPATMTNADGTTSPSVWAREGKAGAPVLGIVDASGYIVHSDLNAVVVGSNPDGSFPPSTYPLESVGKRNPTLPNRLEAFREYTVVFHDEMAASQAFPKWYLDPVLRHTLHAVGDVFMINYGSGGVGTEVIANRLGVGPMHDCLDCVYEEFFLTSSAVGDPAMVVDVPANIGLENCAPPGTGPDCQQVGPKATKAFYPDDPSNVHHSYLNDFVKFRNIHTGKEHHVFHLHNHQWLFNPNDDNANYLDAQGIGPGGGYTYEINFGGSGNRNKSAGDAIFHCHFYPHFAQGMWELWRIHDVYETGTPLAASGTGADGYHATPYALQDGTTAEVAPGVRGRALPDGEIAAGTPIPALVPLPGKPLPITPGKVTVVPKMVGALPLGSVAKIDRTDTDPAFANPQLNPSGLKNPGFPFWIAGAEDAVGQRVSTPPLDMATTAGGWDGGLPRHALDGFAASGCGPGVPRTQCALGNQSRLDMTKEVLRAKPLWYPEDGTDVEKAAMAFHAVRHHPSTVVGLDGTTAPGSFTTNGSGRPVPGAPYHDPCIDDAGTVLHAGVTGQFFSVSGLGITGSSPFNADSPRVYKGSNIQFDAVLNKLGYHFPQERIITLWEDALPTINKQRPPEPLVMRLNTFDCAMYQHTNLVPSVYELDDYQIRTTTDIIGQHIHLPKWDLTTTDGSANGWNYEDGTLSPDAVRERIHAINAFNPTGVGNPSDSAGRPVNTPLEPAKHPFFPAASPGGAKSGVQDWLGARTTLQRWFSDPVVNTDGIHRGLGIIFTHDHFGPSTHQQIGLYATVLTEPPGSTWAHNETGVPMYTRPDGGPTSWQAQIIAGADSYREFYFEYSDFQHAYKPGVYVGRNQDGSLGPAPTADTFRAAVNPSFKQQKATVYPDLVVLPAICPDGQNTRPCPEAITADDPGFMVVNYRNEPIAHRVYDPAKLGPDGKPGSQADGFAGDLAFAFQSRTDRKLPELNVWPAAGTTINGTIFPPPINAGGTTPGDPFTPMMRAYFGDNIRVKVQAGGHEESHNATIFGAKWLQGGSGYGFAPNSGWRNSQHAGISEQFTFASPALPMMNGSAKADHLYAMNASLDGFWSGVWGVYRNNGTLQADLKPLPNNPMTSPLTVANLTSFNGVCPKTAVNRSYDVSAVLANDVLGNGVGATIVPTDGSQTMHVGGPLRSTGGTLVYNPRPTTIAGSFVNDLGQTVTVNHSGPLHDPTAILYVRTSDLVAVNAADPGCKNKQGKVDTTLATCPVKLAATAPVEPLVLRAAAGECINLTLRNRLPTLAPDLAGYKHLPPILVRDANDPQGVTTFNNNLIRPSSYVGLHPSLVAYDVNKDDGIIVGVNGLGTNGAGFHAPPGGTKKYQWYAGDLSLSNQGSTANVVATPVEFGGANIGPADVMKQSQKGLIGALVIEPAGSTWAESDVTQDRQTNQLAADCAVTPSACRTTRASATVNGTIRDLTAVIHKGINQRWKDGTPVEQIANEGVISEDAEDSGQYAINYGSEPLWFRFGIAPHSPFTGLAGMSYANVPNADQAYSNALTGGDPATPVFLASAGREARLHLLEPCGVNRASTFTLHGHVWQRAPYICPGSMKDGLPGKCENTGFFPTAPGNEVASRAIGTSPLGMYMGAQDLIAPGAHFDLFLPSAGGGNGMPGDYLLQDRSGFGNAAGLWSIVRVK